MDIGIVSIRYARALLKGAMISGVEKELYSDMQFLVHSYLQEPALRTTIANPRLRKDKKKNLLTLACGKSCNALTERFIQLVLDNDRENFVPFIASSYVSLYRQKKNIISGRLITATPVSDNVKSKMRSLVQSRTKGTVEFQTEIRPDLIGGFILEYDTYRLDASAKTKLNKILVELKK